MWAKRLRRLPDRTFPRHEMIGYFTLKSKRSEEVHEIAYKTPKLQERECCRKGHFKGMDTCAVPVFYSDLSGQPPQDAVGGQFDTVYKEMVTIACCRKVRNKAMHSKCVRHNQT